MQLDNFNLHFTYLYMDLPQRIAQKRNESESYAILLYALRKLGIFRNLTDNDYGIDFEIELVVNGKVTGRYVKVQVKSKENLTVRQADGIPTIGGIKQSTLFYWTELSFSTHVLLFAVDLKTEEIFISGPLFWQATSLIDSSAKSKTIECIPLNYDKKPSLTDQHNWICALTLMFAFSPTVREQTSTHAIALRSLNSFLKLYSDVFWLDQPLPIDEPEVLRQFLDVCRVLIRNHTDLSNRLPEEDRQNWHSYQHWHRKSQCEAPLHYECAELMRNAMPLLINELVKLRTQVISGAYYWLHKNPEYLRTVLRHRLPVEWNHEQIVKFGHDNQFGLMGDDWEVEEEIRSAMNMLNVNKENIAQAPTSSQDVPPISVPNGK